MKSIRILLGTATIAACALLTSCDEAALAALASNNSGYNQPITPYYEGSQYSNYQSGYSPYTPAYAVPSQAQRQHAFDIGYRVGQDDFRHGLNMSTARHRELFDNNTQESFRSGYSSGYNQSKERERNQQQSYGNVRYNNNGYASSYYPSGYSPYAQAPREAPHGQRTQHSYDIGYRVGQDDFHRNLNKSYSRHGNLFDSQTRSSFSSGYAAGYDHAKAQKRR